MKEQWNKDIRYRLKDFPKKAPESLLDDIKSEMTRRGLPSAQSYHKHTGLFLRMASIAATLFILLGISILWQKKTASLKNSGFSSNLSVFCFLPLII